MSNIYHIARKELREYFASVIGWVFLTLLAFICGAFYWLGVREYARASEEVAMNPMAGQLPGITEWVFGNLFNNMAIIWIFVIPLITMRLLAEERRNHTLEFLMTSPASSSEIVVGKFLGAFAFFAVSLLLCGLPTLWMFYFASPDLGPVLTGVLGALLLGGASISIGLLASSFTQHQFVAAIIAIVFTLTLWLIGFITGAGGGPNTFGNYLSLVEHNESFTTGYIKLESVVYYLSLIVFFLFATLQRLETMRRQ